jgi:hypothetical protein
LDIEDNKNYLQAIYDDECNILCAIAAQADVMGNILGLDTKNDLLSSRGELSHHPQFTNLVHHHNSCTFSNLDEDDGNDTIDLGDDEEAEGSDV